MKAQGWRRKGTKGRYVIGANLLSLRTALPAASEAGHSGQPVSPTGKVLPTRLPRSGLVQRVLWEAGVQHASLSWGMILLLYGITARLPLCSTGGTGRGCR